MPFIKTLLALATLAASSPLALLAQSSPAKGPFELTSALGRKLYALPDDPAVAAARTALAADPKNPALALKLSKALAARRQYNEAVATDTAALASAPNNADLYLERGHRELGLRHFKAAQADLERAAQLDPAMLDAHYHLGLAHYFQGQFAEASEAFTRARDLAKSAPQPADSLIDCTNWLYVSLRRAGEEAEAAAAIARITPDIKNTEPHLFFYLQLLHFYQGKLTGQAVLPPPPNPPGDLESELSFNTVNYGVGNWHLYHHDTPAALKLFRKVVQGEAWNSWGFVGSETDLLRSHPSRRPTVTVVH
jgi:tetratricopeptide (TPR) repeat protein